MERVVGARLEPGQRRPAALRLEHGLRVGPDAVAVVDAVLDDDPCRHVGDLPRDHRGVLTGLNGDTLQRARWGDPTERELKPGGGHEREHEGKGKRVPGDAWHLLRNRRIARASDPSIEGHPEVLRGLDGRQALR